MMMKILVLIVIICALCALLLWQSRHHRQQLRRLNLDLDKLMQQGIPLPIDQYHEGELSILANQMEKVTLRLTQTAERVQQEKTYLADSLADISHQLRTPMTAMNLAVTMLRTQELEHQRRMELTAELRNQLSRMDWLVETLLKISKLDAGTICMSQELIPIRTILDRAAEPLAIPMDIRDQKLIISCTQQQVRADCGWTAEAIGNILKNCMEHTKEHGSIFVYAEDTPIFTRIQIDDTGEGFADEDLAHLFDRFYQGSNACPTSYGLGLALARSIITAQNGTVEAQNWQQGARFIIKFYKQVI